MKNYGLLFLMATSLYGADAWEEAEAEWLQEFPTEVDQEVEEALSDVSNSPEREQPLKRKRVQKKSYQCGVCGCECVSKTGLDKHMRTHTGEKPYECDVCKRGFVLKHHLEGHMRIHGKEKPYGCELCEYECHRKHDLDKHMRTHTGEKPYGCDVCKRGFALRPDLKRHMRIHTGEKPYECEVCKRGFALRYNLEGHMRTHAGKKPRKGELSPEVEELPEEVIVQVSGVLESPEETIARDMNAFDSMLAGTPIFSEEELKAIAPALLEAYGDYKEN